MQLRFTRIFHIVLTAQALPLICGLLIVVALQIIVVNIDNATKNEEKALQALKSSAEAQKVLLRGTVSLVAYLQTDDRSYLSVFTMTGETIQSTLGQLSELRINYPANDKVIGRMQSIGTNFIRYGRQIIALHNLGTGFAHDRLDELQQECLQAFEDWGRLNEILAASVQENLKSSPVSKSSYISTLSCVLLSGLVLVFIACVLTARLLATYIARRLLVVQDNSARLAACQPLLPPLGGTDEISILDHEFHSMAGAISEATRRERNILTSATDIILTVDKNLEIKSGNPACARLWGEGTQLAGRSFFALAPESETGRLKDLFDRCRAAGESGIAEVPLSGTSKYCFASVAVKWSDESKLFSCVLHDITVLKEADDAVRESERRLKAMLEQMPVGMLLVEERSGTVLGGNQLSARLLHRQPEQISGAPLDQLIPIDRSASTPLAWLEAVRQSGRILQALDREDEVRHVEISVNALSVAGTTVLLLADITARQKLELLRRQLVDGISEDIVTPLHSISSVLGKLCAAAHERNDDRFAGFADAAAQESDRLLKLFGDLLEIESSNLQQLSINPQAVAVQELIERSLAAMHAPAEKRGIRLTAEKTEQKMYVDADRMVQVLINLIFNALKFTQAGGYVKLQAAAVDNAFVELKVIDSGAGIPEGMEQVIFEPYKQTKAGDALSKGGAGLGLFICKSIVEKHGGTISACNHDQGAMFVIKLPAGVK